MKSLKRALGVSSSSSPKAAPSTAPAAAPIQLPSERNADSHGCSAGMSSPQLSPAEAPLHPDAHDEGGLACNNDELLKQQREAITGWITSMGKKLFTGNFNLINTPFPVIMFEPRSYLEKLADVWVYPHFLQQASLCREPVERMKLVMAWFVAGLHHGFEKWRKPFNPILGETWQATLSDGSNMFLEQISHHPPITAFQLNGPDESYRFIGLSQPNVSLMLKHYGFRTVAKGYRYIEFADGGRIDLHYPGYCIKGVVYANRPRAEVEGAAVFVDNANQLRGVLHFGGKKAGRSPILRRADAIHGGIYDTRGCMPACSQSAAASQAVTGAAAGRPAEASPLSGRPHSAGAAAPVSASKADQEKAAADHGQHPTATQLSGPPPDATTQPAVRHVGSHSSTQHDDNDEGFESASEGEWDVSEALAAATLMEDLGHEAPGSSLVAELASQGSGHPPPQTAAQHAPTQGKHMERPLNKSSAPVGSPSPSWLPPDMATPPHVAPGGRAHDARPADAAQTSSAARSTAPQGAGRASMPPGPPTRDWEASSDPQPQGPAGSCSSSSTPVASGPRATTSASGTAREAGSSRGLFGGLSKMMGFSGSSHMNGSSNVAGHPSTHMDGANMAGGQQGVASTGELLCHIEGSWLSHMDIDGARYWTLVNERPSAWSPVPAALPSDSRYRQDLRLVNAGDMKGAQAAKEQLENAQRRDKKLREAAGISSHH